MSKDDDGNPQQPNPFCIGEWVLLHPVIEGWRWGQVDRIQVKRSAITAVSRIYPKEDFGGTTYHDDDKRHGAAIAHSGIEAQMKFDGTEEGARLADLLVAACMRRYTPPPETYTFAPPYVLEALAKEILGNDAPSRIGEKWPGQIAARMKQAQRITVIINPA